MTNEEAIRHLEDLQRLYLGNEKFTADIEAIEIAIEALKKQPCEDCISRQAVHEMLENIPINESDKWFNWLQRACLRLAELPSVTPKQAWWIRWYEVIESEDGKSTDYIPHCKCSECDTEYEPHSSQFIKYCPNCGAKMTEGEEV